MREMIPKKISKIDFALMGPKEIRKLSATKVITADTYDDDGFPIPMGLMDLHMGVIEPGLRCRLVAVRWMRIRVTSDTLIWRCRSYMRDIQKQ